MCLKFHTGGGGAFILKMTQRREENIFGETLHIFLSDLFHKIEIHIIDE